MTANVILCFDGILGIYFIRRGIKVFLAYFQPKYFGLHKHLLECRCGELILNMVIFI